MTSAPFKVSYVLMCDDIRTETNGKHIIIGLYSDNIGLSKGSKSFVSPLAFMINGRLPLGATVRMHAWIEGPDGRRLTEGHFGDVEAPKEGRELPAVVMWRMHPWNSETLGHFKLHLVQDDRDEVVFEFDIEDSN